jgi:peptide/nickel transport system substrate-binding protein
MGLKRTVMAAALAATAFASAGFTLAGAAAEEPRQGGTIIVALNADIRSTDPGIDRDANTDTVMHHITETLVAYRNDLSIGPALAESWTISDDGRIYTFTLREGATFHNGAPVTSAEVKWSWERRFDPALAWPCVPYFDGSAGLEVAAVETPDPRTVVFRLAEPNALFLAQLANIQCNIAVIHPDSLNSDGSWDRPVGTGPFMLKEWRKGQFILLERFDDYVPLDEPKSGYAGARIAYADQVRFLIVPDTSVAEAAVYAGEVDLLPGLSAQRMAEAEKNGATIETVSGLAWTAVLVQTEDPLLSDVRLRRAIAHALDIGQIAAVRTNSLVEANPSAVPQNSAFFGESFLAWPEYDPAKAQALLAEAGYTGEPIRIQTNTRYEGMYQNAIIMQAMLASVGINAQLEVLDWATQLDNYLTGKFQIQSFGYSARLDPSLLYGILIGDKSEDPSVQWEDPKALDLLAQSTQTTDTAERKRIFEALHARMAEQIPIYGLYYEPVIDATGPKLKSYEAWPGDKARLWGVWKAE